MTISFSLWLFLCCIKHMCKAETTIHKTKSLIQQTDTTIAFGSCSYPGKDTKIFKTIAQRNPDLFIWTGDATYLDYKNYDPANDYDNLSADLFGIDPAPPSEWNDTWQRIKTDENYQKLRAKVPIIGTWDDHDFGLNDGNGVNNAKYKDYAQQLFLNFLDVPTNSSKRYQKGVYDHYEMEINITDAATKIIDIILLDTRYFAKVDGDENILGNEQWKWLQNVIENKTHGELTILVSSIQTMPFSRGGEYWGKYMQSKNKLFDLLIKYNKNKRLIIVSGDKHFGEIMQMQCIDNNNKNKKQNIYEITSSGLTHGSGDIESFMLRSYVNYHIFLAYEGVYKCRYSGRNFGEFHINWQWNDQLYDMEIENVTASVLDMDGNEKCILNIPLWDKNGNINIDYNEKDVTLSNYNNYTCYGGVKQHEISDKNSQSKRTNMYNIYWYGIPVVFILYTIIMALVAILKWMKLCNRFTKWMGKTKED